MCTDDPSSDASSMSHALSDISCAGESFEKAAFCNRVLGFDILKMGENTKIRKHGGTHLYILLKTINVRNIRKIGVPLLYTTKKLMYKRYEKWGYTFVDILLKLMFER